MRLRISKKAIIFIFLFIVGFLFRMWFSHLVPQPFVFDQEEYYGYALGILKHGVHADIYRLYGYPLIIAPLIYFFGVKSALPWTVFHAVIDTATAFLVFWMGKRISSGAEVSTPWFLSRQGPDHSSVHKGFLAKAMAGLRKGVPPRATGINPALIAFLLYLFNPFTSGYVGVLLSEIVAIFLITLTMVGVLYYLEKKSQKILFSLALLLGFLPQVRPVFVYFSFLVLGFLFVVEQTKIKKGLNKIKTAIILLVFFALPFSYNIITNFTYYHEFAPLSVDRVFARELYASLFIGRGLAFTDTRFGVWPTEALEVWGELAQPKNTVERDAVAKKYTDLAVAKIKSDPSRFVSSRIAKMGYVWEKHFVFPYAQGKPSVLVKNLTYWGNLMVLGLGLFGLVQWIRELGKIGEIKERKIKLWFGYLVIFLFVYISAAHAISTSEERFSLPAYPLVFLFAGYGVWKLSGIQGRFIVKHHR